MNTIPNQKENVKPLIIRATIDNTINPVKPKDEVWAITQRFEEDNGTMEELANAVTGLGLTWCPGIFSEKGRRANHLWIAQQVFALDFDNGITVDEVIERSKTYNLPINFIHPTFTSVNNNKFRVVWCLPVELTDRRVREVIQLGLMKVFPECDRACKDAARMFYGSNKSVICADYSANIDIPTLIDGVCRYIMDTDSNTAAKRIEEWAQSVGLNTLNGLPDVQTIGATVKHNFVVSENSYIYTIGLPPNNEIVFNFAPTKNYTRKGVPRFDTITNNDCDFVTLEKIDWDKLIATCPVTRDFLNGQFKGHDVSFMVLLNFMYLNGGERRFLDTIATYEPNKVITWKSQFKTARKKMYFPGGYDSVRYYYPNLADELGTKNIVQTAKMKRGEIRIMEEIEGKDVSIAYEEAKRYLHEEVRLAVEEGDIAPVVIKVDTGTGKTQLILEIPLEDKMCAFPHHLLIEDVQKRAVAMGKEVHVTPRIPDTPLADAIDSLYSKGAITSAAIAIRSAKDDIDLVEYVATLDRIRTMRGKTIFTTHARLPYLDVHSKVILIDEDIVKTLVNQGTVKETDFFALVEGLRIDPLLRTGGFGNRPIGLKPPKIRELHALSDALTELSDQLKRAPKYTLIEMPKVMLDMKLVEKHVVENKGIQSNVISFLSCSHFIRADGYISFVQRRFLPEGKKIIILSATADEHVYRLLFGESLRFYDTGRVKLKGKLLQYTKHSYSRTSMDNREEETSKLISELLSDGYMVITFKDKMKEFKDIAATFGKLEGLDTLNGKNVAIVGTPYIHPNAYLLTAAAIGIDLKGVQDTGKMEMTEIQRNGYKFNFRTYTFNKMLQHVHLYMIESELVQAVGRARLVRNDTTAKLFSNYPVPGATFAHMA